MKKILIALLAVALLISLAACGKDETQSGGNSTPPTTNESATTSPAVGGNANSSEPSQNTSKPDNDKPTYAEFLAQYELTEADIQPGGFVAMRAWSCAGDEATFYIEVAESGRTVEEIEAWYKNVFSKLKAVSDDGKLYTDSNFKTETVLPEKYSTAATMTTLFYQYNGKTVCVQMGYNGAFQFNKDEIINKSQYEFYIFTA